MIGKKIRIASVREWDRGGGAGGACAPPKFWPAIHLLIFIYINDTSKTVMHRHSHNSNPLASVYMILAMCGCGFGVGLDYIYL